MTVDEQLEKFFSSESFAVSGASTNREKYGNKVLRCYMQHKKGVIPVNPRADSIEGLKTVKALSDLPPSVKSISIITPPKITEMLVDEAIEHGIENIIGYTKISDLNKIIHLVSVLFKRNHIFFQ